MMRYSSPSILISWPEYFPNRIVSPLFTSGGWRLPSSLTLPCPDGEDLASLWFLFGAVGDDDAADALFAFVEALNDETVVQWCDFHVTPDLVVN